MTAVTKFGAKKLEISWRRQHANSTSWDLHDLMQKDIAWQSCGMVPRWHFFASFLRAVFSFSHVQHISGLRSKFGLRPHHVWKYGRHPISDRWD